MIPGLESQKRYGPAPGAISGIAVSSTAMTIKHVIFGQLVIFGLDPKIFLSEYYYGQKNIIRN